MFAALGDDLHSVEARDLQRWKVSPILASLLAVL